MDTKAQSLYKNLSIVLVYLQSSLFVDNFIIYPFPLPAKLINILIFFNLGIIAFKSYPRVSFDILQKKIIIILFIIIFYFFFIWAVLYGFNLTGLSTRHAIKTIVMGLFIFVILNDPRFNMKRFLNTILYVGFVFAFLSLYLYFGYSFGFVGLKTYTLHGYSAGSVRVGNIGGYINPSGYGQHLFLRNGSYWSEPSKFAQFLQFPLFFALQRYLNNKNSVNIILLLVISTAMLTTFSVANFFGILIAFVFFTLLNRKTGKYTFKLLRIKQITLFILFTFILIQFYTITNQEGYKSEVIIGKSTNQSIIGRIERFNIVLDEIKNNPLGSITFGQEYSTNPSAFGGAIMLGGLPFLIIIIILLLIFYKKLIFNLKKSVNGLMIIGSFAFVIAHFWYGSFAGIYFIFNLALFSTILKYDKLGNKLLN